MPPRPPRVVANDPMRRDILREFVVTEGDIEDLRRLHIDDALWRIGHERDVHISWAHRRADFLTNEVRIEQTPSTEAEHVVGSVVHFVQPRGDSQGAMKMT